MSKLKYPKKYEGKKTPIKFPVYDDKLRAWMGAALNKNGKTTFNGFTGFIESKNCWVPCMAHNIRVGYSYDEIVTILKHYGFWKKEIKKGFKEVKERQEKRDKALRDFKVSEKRGLSNSGKARNKKRKKKKKV